jgi:hypothetical protein
MEVQLLQVVQRLGREWGKLDLGAIETLLFHAALFPAGVYWRFFHSVTLSHIFWSLFQVDYH